MLDAFVFGQDIICSECVHGSISNIQAGTAVLKDQAESLFLGVVMVTRIFWGLQVLWGWGWLLQLWVCSWGVPACSIGMPLARLQGSGGCKRTRYYQSRSRSSCPVLEFLWYRILSSVAIQPRKKPTLRWLSGLLGWSPIWWAYSLHPNTRSQYKLDVIPVTTSYGESQWVGERKGSKAMRNVSGHRASIWWEGRHCGGIYGHHALQHGDGGALQLK